MKYEFGIVVLNLKLMGSKFIKFQSIYYFILKYHFDHY